MRKDVDNFSFRHTEVIYNTKAEIPQPFTGQRTKFILCIRTPDNFTRQEKVLENWTAVKEFNSSQKSKQMRRLFDVFEYALMHQQFNKIFCLATDLTAIFRLVHM